MKLGTGQNTKPTTTLTSTVAMDILENHQSVHVGLCVNTKFIQAYIELTLYSEIFNNWLQRDHVRTSLHNIDQLSSAALVWHNYPIAVFCTADCPRPPAPLNGHVGYGSISTGAVVKHFCDSNYHLQGFPERTCLPNGLWSGTLPRCIRKSLRM